MVLFVLAASGAAWGQTPCALAHYGSTDGGWLSFASRADCGCGDCRVFVEVRPATANFGDPGSFSGAFDNQYGSFYFSLADGVRYSWRATPRFADGGTLPMSLESLATAHMASPTEPAELQLTREDGGLVSFSFDASVDLEVGIAHYRAIYRHVSSVENGLFGYSAQSPLRSDLGPGDWVVGVAAQNNVDAQSYQTFFPSVVHVDPDPALSPPPAPVMSSAVYGSPAVVANVTVTADAIHLLGEDEDGGLAVRFDRTTAGATATAAYGWFPSECRHRVKAARVLNGQVSDWSDWSATFVVDLTPPTAPGAVTVAAASTSISVTWGPAADTCGVDHYVVERSSDQGGYGVVAPNVIGLAFVDLATPGASRLDYRVTAVDRAGRKGPPLAGTVMLSVDAGSQVDSGVLDGGVLDGGVLDSGVLDGGVLDGGVLDGGVLDGGVLDGGVPDGGVVDGGIPDSGVGVGGRDGGAGGRRDYFVGCSCAASDGFASVLALLMLALNRRKR